MITAQVVAELVAAGLSGEALVAACQRIEAAIPPDTMRISTGHDAEKADAHERRKAWDRERKRRARENSTGQERKIPPDKADTGGTIGGNLPSFLPDSGKKDLEIQHAREDRFAEFWAAYPRREGTNPRKPAADKFARAVARGADPVDIISGAHRYAQHLKATGKDGSRFVQQAVTWLNQESWKDEYHQGQNKHDDRDIMGAIERVRTRFGSANRADAQGGGFSDELFDRPHADLDLSADHIDH